MWLWEHVDDIKFHMYFVLDMKASITYSWKSSGEVLMPLQPFPDDLGHRRRTALLLFYLAALFSAIAISLVSKAPPFRTVLLALAVPAAGTAVLFLFRFPRPPHEREQQINNHPLPFSFSCNLLFFLAFG